MSIGIPPPSHWPPVVGPCIGALVTVVILVLTLRRERPNVGVRVQHGRVGTGFGGAGAATLYLSVYNRGKRPTTVVAYCFEMVTGSRWHRRRHTTDRCPLHLRVQLADGECQGLHVPPPQELVDGKAVIRHVIVQDMTGREYRSAKWPLAQKSPPRPPDYEAHVY